MQLSEGMRVRYTTNEGDHEKTVIAVSPGRITLSDGKLVRRSRFERNAARPLLIGRMRCCPK